MPHWMNRKDTIAVPWLASYKRNPLPKDVIWIQDDILRDQFYWLGTPIESAKQGLKARVAVSGNDITILENQNETLYLYLNDGLVNLDKKVTVTIDGKQVFNQKVSRNADVVKKTVAARMDKGLIFTAGLVIKNGLVTSM